MGKRIWQYPEATSISENDYLLLDNQTDGSKSIKANLVGSILIDKTVTERKTYTAADDNVDGYKKVIVDVPYTDVHYQKGDIVTFDDGEDLPLASLKTTIVPIQDLHGYNSPWVGGSGKNKFDQDTAYASYKQSDGSFRITGNAVTLMKNYIPQSLVGQQVTVSVYFDLTKEASPNGVRIACNIGGTETESSRVESNQKKTLSLTFTPTATTDYWYITYGNTGANYFTFKDCQLEIGSSATSYAPYENICPIIGWSGVNVSVADDITNKEYFDGLLNGTYGVVDLGSYTYTAASMSNDRTAYCISIYDLPVNPKYDTSSVPNAVCSKFLPTYQTASAWMVGEFVFTGSAGTLPQNSLGFITKTSDYADATAFKNAMNGVHLIYELATLTTPTVTPSEINELYEEFGINGHTYTIPFTDSQGNPIEVFGGECDVVNGGGSAYKEYDSYNGETLIGPWISDRDVYAPNTSPTIGAQVVDMGDTSTFTSQPTSIKSLEGTNNVWGDCGPVAVEWQTLYVTPTE